jgi:translation initiation factor IF-2
MEILAGRVRNYYKKLNVASIEVTDSLKVGDRLHIKGHFTDFDQEIYSIEIGHTQVKEAAKGQTAGIKIDYYVRKNDLLYRVE